MFFKINFSLFIDKRKIMCIFTPLQDLSARGNPHLFIR